jgi:hypothetical protein
MLLHQQEFAILFDDGGNDDVGFPDFVGHGCPVD